VPEKVLTDRIRQARAVITCCGANLEYLQQIAPSQQSKFSLVYHGVNLKDFQVGPNSAASSVPENPIILSVGRLVEKKGFQDYCRLTIKEKGQRFLLIQDGPLLAIGEMDREPATNEVKLMGDRTQRS
jgi:glycosyltransferase involved in cell wall biosynthesis